MARLDRSHAAHRSFETIEGAAYALALLVELLIPAVVKEYDHRCIIYDAHDRIRDSVEAVRRAVQYTPVARRARCDSLIADIDRLAELIAECEMVPVYTTDVEYLSSVEVAETRDELDQMLSRLRQTVGNLRDAERNPK